MPYWPLQAKLITNVDRLGATITKAINTLRDDLLEWRRFPGLQGFVRLAPTGIVSVHWWDSQGVAVAVGNGTLHIIGENGSAQAITGATFLYTRPVYFVDYGTSLYAVNGGAIVKYGSGDATCSNITDGDAPTVVVALKTFDSYLMALDPDGVVWHSDAANPDNWLAETILANSKPDKTIAIETGWEEFSMFGTSSIQGFFNAGDPLEPIQSIQGSTVEVGIIATNSLQIIDNTYYFLDGNRKVQKFRGRQNVIISEPINADLQALDTVDDAIGFHLQCEGETLYCLVFPTDGKGFAYDYKRDDWCEFASFADGDFGPPVHRTAAYCKGWGKQLVGGSDGMIYLASTAYNTNDGAELRAELRIRANWGTDDWKICNKVRFKLKRGHGQETMPKLLLSYRDNGKSVWSNEKTLDLGTADFDREAYVEIRRLGRYRDREWRLVITDDVPFLLVSAEESISRG